MFILAEVGQENIIASLLDFRSNMVNWILLVILIVWAIKKYVPAFISQRQQAINNELELAANTRKEAEQALAQQKQKIEQATKEAEQIILEAKHAAKQMAEDLKQQTENDISDLRKKFELSAHNERQAAIVEMRNIVAKAAVQLAEENLRSTLTASNKTKIAQEFMGELGKVGGTNVTNEMVSDRSNANHNPQKVVQT